jgi:ATP-dependent RNA helicase RhlE
MNEERKSGTLKWFNGRKGFGFVAPDDGSADVFVHQSAIRAAGMRRIEEGQRIEYSVTHSDKGPIAEMVFAVEAGMPNPQFVRPDAGREIRKAPAPAPLAAVEDRAPVSTASDVSFAELGLIEPLLRALKTEGYTTPTPIQSQAIPQLLEGRDMLGCAQTGTGKTAAFALPILQRMVQIAPQQNGNKRRLRTLVLSPTRELAAQIGESFRAYGRHLGFTHTVVFGGVSQNSQVSALRRGVDIVVATPGRLLDLKDQGVLRLDSVEVFVLDEADRMLDMGFIHDVQRVIGALPRNRQTMLFSATMPKEITSLAESMMHNPIRVSVTPDQPTVETIDQAVYLVKNKKDKQPLLEHLLRDKAITRVLVFTRTKHGANKVVRQLGVAGITSEPIHGNKTQAARERALANFKSGRTRVLVATDVAARGIDIDSISHVIQYDLPNIPETYVHRIGRTGRAGASGIALAFCDPEERSFLKDIEKLIHFRIDVVQDHPYSK